MRYSALLLCLCACTTLSNDEADRLQIYRRNAPLYFEGGKLEQAMIQVERGLEIDPDDYKLNVIKGAVLVRASEQNPKLLERGSKQLEKIYDWRSPMRHEKYMLFFYGLARQGQGQRHLQEANRFEAKAERSGIEEVRKENYDLAKEERRVATADLTQADELLGYLAERGELLRLVHSHRMQIARQLRNDKRFKTSVEAFFVASAKEQEVVEADVKQTETPDYEAQQYKTLQDLQAEEADVRALYAEWLFQRKNFDQALAQLNRALQIDPGRSVEYWNRGRVLVELKKTEDAKADFRRFLATSTLPAADSRMTYATKAITR